MYDKVAAPVQNSDQFMLFPLLVTGEGNLFLARECGAAEGALGELSCE